MAEYAERVKNLPRWETLDIAEEYARHRLCFLVNFDVAPVGDIPNIGVGRSCVSRAESVIGQNMRDCAVAPPDSYLGDFDGPNYWGQGGVFVRIVYAVKRVNHLSLSRGEHLQRLEKVADRLTGCFYSVTRGFKIDPVVACGQRCMTALFTAVMSDQVPHHVIEGNTKIVDSVAYCEGEGRRDFLSKDEPDGCVPGFGIVAYGNTVRLLLDKRLKLRFKVMDVMYGPFDL